MQSGTSWPARSGAVDGTVARMGDSDHVVHLLATARELVGQSEVVLRIDTDLIETVYVEVRDGDVIVHDRGETWFYIVTHPDSYVSWDPAQALRFCGESSVTMATEADDGGLRPVVLERSLVVDALFGAHSLPGSWRGV